MTARPRHSLWVRIMGVARLSTRRIAVANRGTNDVRIFDASARHVTTFGRTGEGPGEFRRLGLGRAVGDTAWFYDSGLQRITAVLLGAKPRELSGTTRADATGKRESFLGQRAPARWSLCRHDQRLTHLRRTAGSPPASGIDRHHRAGR